MMKIISSFMDDLPLVRNECHTIAFESSQIQMKFRSLVNEFFRNRKMDDNNYLDFININGQSIPSKDFYFIEFNCFSINLKDEKDTSKWLLDLLEFELEHNEDLLDMYKNYLAETEDFVNRLELNEGNFKIEFQTSDKSIQSLLKSLTMTIEYDEDKLVTNNLTRELLIKAMIKLNLTNKEVVLLISFPEVDIGNSDYEDFMKFIEGLGVTTIIQSSNPFFITYPVTNRVFLINKNGEKYDNLSLKDELVLFKLVEIDFAEKLANSLAYSDFMKDYFLLDPRFKKFLLSNRN